MNQPAWRTARYQDLFDLPENQVGEIIHGQLYAQPRPAPRHARASSVLGGELITPYDQGRGGPGGWWLLDEPEVHLDQHILVPDIAGWRRQRLPNLPDEAYFTLPPDWICEVLSPSTARTDRVLKMPIYAEFGVTWLWLVDPDLKTLEVFSLSEGHWRLEHAWQQNDAVNAPPFAEVTLKLNDLWVS